MELPGKGTKSSRLLRTLDHAHDELCVVGELPSSYQWKPFGEINPTRGLRQGDPVCPYLFVMCTKMLIQMMKQAEAEGKITGLKVARGSPAVSHLVYTRMTVCFTVSKTRKS